MTLLPCLFFSVLPAQPVLEPAPPLFAAFAPSAPEEFPEFEYTYIEASYLWLDSDTLDDELNGWDLTGSFELPANFFLQATVRQQSSDADVNKYSVGAGWHFGLLGRLDTYGVLSYQHIEVDGSASDFDEDGVGAELGLRFSLTRRIELNGRFLWTDIDESDSGGGLGARFYFTERLSAGAYYDKFGSDDQVTAGLRFEL